jgi:hypothetical protein
MAISHSDSKDISIDHSPDGSHVEKRGSADVPGVAFVDHRENDDRAAEAMGRNADQFDRKYWLSINFLGTMFAIGMAFMGGIGGEWFSRVFRPAYADVP